MKGRCKKTDIINESFRMQSQVKKRLIRVEIKHIYQFQEH